MTTLHKLALVAGLMTLAQETLRGADDSIVIVANSSVSVTAIAPDDLREVFLGTQHSLSNGAKVTAVLLKGGPVHESFLKTYLGKSPEGFRAWWLQMVFTGQRLMPKTFDSEADLVNYVGRNRGSIGYATRASVRGNVKCVAVTNSHEGTP